jgi:SNF2 family DNA or RNA helicase
MQIACLNGYNCEVTLQRTDGRIVFTRAPFVAKDEIKSLRGARWNKEKKQWSIDDCARNDFRLRFLSGENVYAPFDQTIIANSYERPLRSYQCDLVDAALTKHYQYWAAEMGVGKTLAAQELIERADTDFYWIGPKTSLPNIEREFRKWGFKSKVEMLTYEGLVSRMQTSSGYPPHGIMFDEASRLKTANSQRSKAAQEIADRIRKQWGMAGYVVLMSGTPSPKSPLDWWSPCEICWPGFLREGSPQQLEKRLAFLLESDGEFGKYWKRLGWRDDERKCGTCGELHGPFDDDHVHSTSINEIKLLHERLKGLVVVKHKKDCLSLPDKQYRKVECQPSASTLRVADALYRVAEKTVTAATWLRELSDGFQYREVQDGTTKCDHCQNGKVGEWFEGESGPVKREVDCPLCQGTQQKPNLVRVTKEVPCPKDAELKLLLDECEETGRIVIFAGFTGSVDRIVKLCKEKNWATVRCDGRGFQVTDGQGYLQTMEPLDYWADLENNPRVAFVAHPESGGMSLTLVESRMAVFWSNSFKPEYRIQAEDRIHRIGMDENKGCVIVDLVHLPSDERVIEVIRDNRRLELMTLGEFMGAALAA